MKKIYTLFIFAMLILSLGFVVADNDNGAKDGTSPEHDVVIAAGGMNGTGLQGEFEDNQNIIGEDKGNLEKGAMAGLNSNESQKKEKNIFLFRERAKTQEVKSCVAELTSTKNSCYQESKTSLNQCRFEAKSAENPREARALCRENYKVGKENCKNTFSTERDSCLAMNNTEELILAAP
jgi:hypothetical protein